MKSIRNSTFICDHETSEFIADQIYRLYATQNHWSLLTICFLYSGKQVSSFYLILVGMVYIRLQRYFFQSLHGFGFIGISFFRNTLLLYSKYSDHALCRAYMYLDLNFQQCTDNKVLFERSSLEGHYCPPPPLMYFLASHDLRVIHQ